ncbi:MAG TPA: alpha/beta hydrolase-fold protein, partial [Chitinophagaceae bacterium]|nr:alpha/beta hydrolase-fold protein [Chitinophagaceae bacterium]
MCKYLLLLLILITVTAAESQNVFNSGDPVINYNSGAAPGSAANPNGQLAGMQKWVRTRNTSRIPWDDTKFKCYYWKPTTNFGVAFRLRYPNNYDSTKKYPLILFLHGAGEVAPITENEDHLFWGAQTFQSSMDAGAWNGFLLFPQQTSAGWDNNYFMLCNSILDTLARYKGFDQDRLITMGLSEGGYGAISMASLYPQRVASIVSSSPIDLTNIGNQADYVHIPVFWANGGTDANPDPYSSYNYYDNMHNMGANWVQQFYSTQGHAIWTYQWTVQDINGVPLMYNYWNSAHKAQPLVYFGQTQFCAGTPVSAKLGITAGFYAYQWQMSTGGGAFADIPGGIANTYTATQAGTYRVHFKRTSTSDWSDWTPKPVVISVKSCAIDTAFSENFEYWKPYMITSTPQEFKANYTRFDCENSIYTTGAENFTNDAAGNTGARYSINYTNSNGGACTYTTTGKIWGLNGNVPAVKQNTNYLFTFYAANQTTTNRAALVPYIGTTAVTNLLTKPVALPTSTTGNLGWTRFTYLWNSGSNSFADMSLHNNTTSTSGNDFAIDEISLTRQLAPGGVGTNLMLWNKADILPEADSTKLMDWANASGGTPLTQLSAGNKPILRDNASDNINFNPLVSFKNSLSQNMAVSGGFSAATTHTAAHIFMVARVNNNTQNTTLVAEAQSGSNGRVGVSLPFGGNVVWDAGNTSNSSHMTT